MSRNKLVLIESKRVLFFRSHTHCKHLSVCSWMQILTWLVSISSWHASPFDKQQIQLSCHQKRDMRCGHLSFEIKSWNTDNFLRLRDSNIDTVQFVLIQLKQVTQHRSNKERVNQGRNKAGLTPLHCLLRDCYLADIASIRNNPSKHNDCKKQLNKRQGKNSPGELECQRNELACSETLHNGRLLACSTNTACTSGLRRIWMCWLFLCFVSSMPVTKTRTITVRSDWEAGLSHLLSSVAPDETANSLNNARKHGGTHGHIVRWHPAHIWHSTAACTQHTVINGRLVLAESRRRHHQQSHNQIASNRVARGETDAASAPCFVVSRHERTQRVWCGANSLSRKLHHVAAKTKAQTTQARDRVAMQRVPAVLLLCAPSWCIQDRGAAQATDKCESTFHQQKRSISFAPFPQTSRQGQRTKHRRFVERPMQVTNTTSVRRWKWRDLTFLIRKVWTSAQEICWTWLFDVVLIHLKTALENFEKSFCCQHNSSAHEGIVVSIFVEESFSAKLQESLTDCWIRPSMSRTVSTVRTTHLPTQELQWPLFARIDFLQNFNKVWQTTAHVWFAATKKEQSFSHDDSGWNASSAHSTQTATRAWRRW